MKYFDELCLLITQKYNIDYIIIDENFIIKEFSDGVINFTDDISKEMDIRDYFYEFVGYEDDIKNLKNEDNFELTKVNKNSYYIDIYIQPIKNQKDIIILIENITQKVEDEQLIWQDRNNKALMINKISNDIKLHKKSNEKLIDIAHKDALTKFLNRLGLNSKLAQLIEKQKEFSLMFLDLDHFKYVNDNYGHYVGDILLCEASQRLKNSVPKNSILTRYGGDEFIIILFDIENINQIAQNIINNISKVYMIEKFNLKIGVSIGITKVLQDNRLNIDELISKADEAMYISKKNGKNRFSYII